jgi:hypothetical protein
MYDPENRVLILTRALENLLECFVDCGDYWGTFIAGGDLVPVSPDLESTIEQAQATLYNEEEDLEEESESDSSVDM